MADRKEPACTWTLRMAHWILYDHRVKPNMLVVYLHLLRHMNASSRRAWPSWRTIAARSGLSRSTVARAIRALKWIGLIVPVEAGTLTKCYEMPNLSEIYFDVLERGEDGAPSKWAPKDWFADSIVRRGFYYDAFRRHYDALRYRHESFQDDEADIADTGHGSGGEGTWG